jgi:hypothetical protein
MRVFVFPLVTGLTLFMFFIGCGNKTPQPGDQAGTGTPNPDSIQAMTSSGTTDSIKSANMVNENYPLKGQPEALADTSLALGRAGAVYLGMPVDSIYIAYGREQIRVEDMEREGQTSSALGISLPGGTEDNPSLVAELSGNLVRRIRIYDSRFRTSGDIGQGSTFSELRQKCRVSQVAEREGSIMAVTNEPGILFILDPSDIPQDYYRTRNLNLIHGSTRINYLLVYGKDSIGSR